MLQFDAAQAREITRLCFFQRVRAFIREQSRHPAFVARAQGPAPGDALWAPLWPALQAQGAHDAAVGLAFALACDALGLSPAQALAPIGAPADPPLAMKLFLARRGLLRFSAFDCPELTR